MIFEEYDYISLILSFSKNSSLLWSVLKLAILVEAIIYPSGSRIIISSKLLISDFIRFVILVIKYWDSVLFIIILSLLLYLSNSTYSWSLLDTNSNFSRSWSIVFCMFFLSYMVARVSCLFQSFSSKCLFSIKIIYSCKDIPIINISFGTFCNLINFIASNKMFTAFSILTLIYLKLKLLRFIV